jgi:putative ABC transport system substrate-binding protein
MRRRTFIAGLSSAAAWPLVARAQQPEIPVVAFFDAASLETEARGLAEFRKGLSDIGYVEGQNVLIDYGSAEGDADRLPALAASMIRRGVAVIAAMANNAAVTAKAATTTIPIVFTVGGDPIQMGLVDNLNRPGRNITGVSFLSSDIMAKMLEALVTDGGSVTILRHPSLAGMASGSGLSGSTGWQGAFRFHQYLRSAKSEGMRNRIGICANSCSARTSTGR